MRACWAVTLLVLVQPSPASCATCTGTSVVPRARALTHRHLRKSPSVRQPFAEISGSISFSPPVVPFPETVPNFVCHFKGSLQREARISQVQSHVRAGQGYVRTQPPEPPLKTLLHRDCTANVPVERETSAEAPWPDEIHAHLSPFSAPAESTQPVFGNWS